MIELFTKDLDKLEKLISLGYENSLKSLSTIVQQVAQIKIEPLEIWDVTQKRTFVKSKSENISVLRTNIKGEIEGRSYLLLDDVEVDALVKHCKAPTNLKEAFLLELDNMLAAAVTTVFSNYCQLKIYGDVPEFTEVVGDQLMNFIVKDLEELNDFDGICLVAETHFVFEGNLEIKPQFLWFLPEQFVKAVHEKVSLEKFN